MPRRSFETAEEEDRYLWECLHTDRDTIQEEYVRLPTDIAHWGDVYARVYGHWLQAKADRDETAAREADRLLLEHELDTGKTLSGAAIEKLVARTPAMRSAVAKAIAAEQEKMRIASVVDALRAKKDMLVSLGAHMRLEFGAYGKGDERE